GERAAILRAQPALEGGNLAGNHVEQACGLAHHEAALRRRIALTEQAQEELTRVALHGQRRRGVAERERARVAAAVAALTGTAHAMPLRSGRLQRGPGRLL